MKNTNNLTTQNIPTLIKQLAIPASTGMFFNTMYNVVDTFYVGMISTVAITALSYSFMVFFMILSISFGLSSAITGTSVTRAGGGGGAQSGFAGAGGTGGGGTGGTPPTAGAVNTGGGGGGRRTAGIGGAGGSGIVILRYPKEYTITVGDGLTSSTSTDGLNKVTSFTAGTDTITFAA